MSDPLSDVFRANVRVAMRLARITQGELARRLGCSCDTVGKTLNNPRGIGVTLTTVARYSRALGIEPAVLVTPDGVQRNSAARLVPIHRTDRIETRAG